MTGRGQAESRRDKNNRRRFRSGGRLKGWRSIPLLDVPSKIFEQGKRGGI